MRRKRGQTIKQLIVELDLSDPQDARIVARWDALKKHGMAAGWVKRTLYRALQSTDANGQVTDSPRAAVKNYLAAHPEAVSMSVRKLGQAAGVSKTIAAEVLKEWKA